MPRRLIVSVEWALTRPNDTAEAPFPHTKRKCHRQGVCKTRRNRLPTTVVSYGFAPCSNSDLLLVPLCVLFCISSRDPVHDAESLHSLFIAHDLLWTLSTVGDVTARRERQRSRLRISSTLQPPRRPGPSWPESHRLGRTPGVRHQGVRRRPASWAT